MDYVADSNLETNTVKHLDPENQIWLQKSNPPEKFFFWKLVCPRKPEHTPFLPLVRGVDWNHPKTQFKAVSWNSDT